MAVIFVHGVNNRKEEPGYGVRCLLIEKFLAKHLAGVKINKKTVTIAKPRFPYWGDLATKFAWDMQSLPSEGIDSLGPSGVEPDLRPLVATFAEQVTNARSASGAPLLEIAKKSLSQSVQLVADLLLGEIKADQSEKVADFIFCLQEYAETNPSPPWLVGLTTDAQFINKIANEASKQGQQGPEALGATVADVLYPLTIGASKFKAAVASAPDVMLDITGNFISTRLLAWGRRPLNATLGRFFGDVFVYLDTRNDKNDPGEIPRRVLSEIDNAIEAAPSQDPVVIIGHSLGGVIIYDLLSHFRPELNVDLFVSVGSQVSHFEEVKRFKNSDPHIGHPERVRPPSNIKHWINVFDPVDIFSYACSKIFERVEDFSYDTRTYTIKAHGAYLGQARFYERLRKRIDELKP